MHAPTHKYAIRIAILIALAVLCLWVCPQVWSQSASTTTLSLSSASAPVGNAVTLTGKVTVGGSALTTGLVQFCDATAARCQGAALLGQRQLTAAGSAQIVLRLSPGAHSVKAAFAGTLSAAASSSAAQTITFTGGFSTTMNNSPSGVAGNYSVISTVSGTGSRALTGSVSLMDMSNGGMPLGSAPLGTSSSSAGFNVALSSATGAEPAALAVGDVNGDGWPDIVVANLNSNTLTILLGQGHGVFVPGPQTPATGVNPSAVALGDFNADGRLDIAVTNTNSYNVTILLGNGDGTFTTQTPSPSTGVGPVSIVAGDFNRDGRVDLAVANQNDSTVTLLFGKGDGTFQPALQTLSTSYFPQSIVLGDFNGDGKQDLVTTNYFDSSLTIFLGKGDGTFGVGSRMSIGIYPTGVAVGDFNGDGKQDLATVNSFSQTVTVLLGDGAGNFTVQPTSPVTGIQPDSIAIADFDGDGVLDIVVAEAGSNDERIFMGKGNGSFSSALVVANGVGTAPHSVVAADFNADGRADMATANGGINSATAYLNTVSTNASANFSGIKVPGGGVHLIAASYAGDGNYATVSNTFNLSGTPIPVAVSVNFEPSTTVGVGETVQLNATVTPAKLGVFNAGGTFSVSNGATLLASAPAVNGFGVLNVTPTQAGTESLIVKYSGDNNFAAAASAPKTLTVVNPVASTITFSSTPATVAHGTPVTLTATVTAGGNAVTHGTVLFCQINSAACIGRFFIGQAQLTANGTASLKTTLPSGTNVVVAIFQGTGQVKGSTSVTHTVTITGTFATNTTLAATGSAGNYTLTAGVASVSGNPLLGNDVRFVDTSNQNFVLGNAYEFGASTNFVQTSAAGTAVNAVPVVAGDFNGDGYQDTATAGQVAGNLVVQLNNGNGTFTAKPSSITLGPATMMSTGDFNNDGRLDIAVANYGVDSAGNVSGTIAGSVKILLGNGDGTFTLKATLPVGIDPTGMAIGDFNNDGNLDIAVANANSTYINILLGNGDGSFSADPAFLAASDPGFIVAADFNKDGNVDLAITNNSSLGGVTILFGNGDGTFTPSTVTYAQNTFATSLVLADFNNDGNTDIALIGGNNSEIILQGFGPGQYAGQFAVVVAGPGTPSSYEAVAADFNGDGNTDLVTSDAFAGTVTLLTRASDGSFSRNTITPPSGSVPSGIVSADFDGDGWPDIAFGDFATGRTYVMASRSHAVLTLGSVAVPGSGAHQVQATYIGAGPNTASSSGLVAVQGTPQLTAVVITNSPGAVVTAGQALQTTVEVYPIDNYAPSGTVSLYNGSKLLGTSTLTNGKSTFATSFATVGTYNLVATFAGNINIASSSSLPTPVYVVPATTTTLAASSASITTGTVLTLTATVASSGTKVGHGLVTFCDATATACTDTALIGSANLMSNGTATLRIRPGIGTHSYKAVFSGSQFDAGSTSATQTVTVTGLHNSITVLKDVVTSGLHNLTASVIGTSTETPTGTVSFVDTSNANSVLGTATLGTGVIKEAFSDRLLTATDASALVIATGDFNHDGTADIALVNDANPGVTILLGSGNGTFVQKSILPMTGYVDGIAIADFNADGNLDVAVANQTSSTVSIYLGAGDGTFTLKSSLSNIAGAAGLAVGDFNRDGIPDLAVAENYNNSVNVLFGDGAGNFPNSSTISMGGSTPIGVTVGDLNGDGNQDIVAANFSGPISVILGAGNGTFTLSTLPPPATNDSSAVAIGDFNHDGKPDLAVTRVDTNDVLILTGNGDGTFVPGSVIPVGIYPTSIAATDFNLDGKLDLVVARSSAGSVALLTGNGTGGFSLTNIPIGATNYGSWVAIGDFNGDGKPDIAVGGYTGSTSSVLMNTLGTTATATLSNVQISGTANQNVVAKFPGSSPYAASTSVALSLAPTP